MPTATADALSAGALYNAIRIPRLAPPPPAKLSMMRPVMLSPR